MISEETREDFVQSIYDMFSDNSTNDRANQIIDIFDISTENCIELPCKVGDTVYITGEKYPCEITEIIIDKYGIHFNWVSFEKSYELTEVWNYGDFTVDDIGKTVFLTKEEAEKALEGA